MNKYKVDKNRIWDRIQAIGEIGKDPDGGNSRFAFSGEDREAIDIINTWLDDLGLKAHKDTFGNILCKVSGKQDKPVVLIGSHLDTVRNGGKFDGVAGVIAALEVCQLLKENNIETELPVELIIYENEEGSRFPGGLMGSRAIAGRLKKDEIFKIEDKSGVKLADAMIECGANPDKIEEAKWNPSDIKISLELHIEQASVLENNDLPVGIVTGIAGIHQMELIIEGKTGHSGAVPMKGRRDPLILAAMIIQEVERSALEGGPTLRGTVGYIKAEPGGHNIISKRVAITLDYRDVDPIAIKKAVNRVKQFITKEAKKRNLKIDIKDTLITPETIIDKNITNLLQTTADNIGISTMLMLSGAGHDSMVMAGLCPIGMIFVRSHDGISHAPEEFSSKEDLAMGTQLLFNAILKVSNGAL